VTQNAADPTDPGLFQPAPDDASSIPSPIAEEDRVFEDLTLSEAFGLLWRKPVSTLRGLASVARTPKEDGTRSLGGLASWASDLRSQPLKPTGPMLPMMQVEAAELEQMDRSVNRLLESLQLVVRIAAVLLAIWGGIVVLNDSTRSDGTLATGASFWLFGFGLWLLAEVIGLAPGLNQPTGRAKVYAPPAGVLSIEVFALRGALAALGGLASLIAFQYSTGNRFTAEGVAAWITSVIFWVWAVAPTGWNPLVGLRQIGSVFGHLRISWAAILLIAITVFGAFFRLTDLNSTPPEMTSDHVEKLLDAYRVYNGQFNIFFANNHGRDPMHFYLLALLGHMPGLEFNLYLLKLMTAIEGIVTIPVLYFMGKAVIGKDDPKLGQIVGLALAALVAVSYWHEMLSRLGLRIVLTPLMTALLVLVLARALRSNRRGDFILVGLVLGVGVYTYQATRMLPVVAIAGVALALIFNMRTWADRGRMLVNLAVAGLVAFVVFVPLFRYSLEYPEDFWRRTSGRLFGDDISQQTDEEGRLIFRQATLEERFAAFNENLPALANNFRNVLLMYNWKGDIAWINNAPNMPALDTATGALLIVGLAAWLVRMLVRRDGVDWLIPLMILIMLLPSALAIAYPIENPSFTRASGSLPGVYLLAAFALALLVRSFGRVLPRMVGYPVGAVAAAVVVFIAYSANANTYFIQYRNSYVANSLPYSDAGRLLRSFAQNAGYGNVFIVGFPYWWDHRALGIEGGAIDWPNGIPSLQELPEYLANGLTRTDRYRLNPDADLLFFFSPGDSETESWLKAFLPLGVEQQVIPYQPEDVFKVYRVPALGAEGFNRVLQMAGVR
jgi:hypothetical protein